MFCTSKEQETCEVEKRGCEGCFYNKEVPTPDNPILIELERRSPQSEAKYWNEKYIDTLLKLFKEKEKNDELLKAIDIVNEDKQMFIESYEQEKETSHHLQNRLDEADAKLLEEKQKNKNQEEVIDMMAEEIWRCNAIDCDFKHFKDNICKDEQDTGNKQICKECIKKYYLKKARKE